MTALVAITAFAIAFVLLVNATMDPKRSLAHALILFLILAVIASVGVALMADIPPVAITAGG